MDIIRPLGRFFCMDILAGAGEQKKHTVRIICHRGLRLKWVSNSRLPAARPAPGQRGGPHSCSSTRPAAEAGTCLARGGGGRSRRPALFPRAGTKRSSVPSAGFKALLLRHGAGFANFALVCCRTASSTVYLGTRGLVAYTLGPPAT